MNRASNGQNGFRGSVGSASRGNGTIRPRSPCQRSTAPTTKRARQIHLPHANIVQGGNGPDGDAPTRHLCNQSPVSNTAASPLRGFALLECAAGGEGLTRRAGERTVARRGVSLPLVRSEKEPQGVHQASQFAGRHVGPALRRHPGSAAHHLLHVLWVTDRSHGESPKQESPCGVRAPGESLPVTMEKEDPVAKESISCQRPVSREKARTAACKGSVRKMPQRRKDG